MSLLLSTLHNIMIVMVALWNRHHHTTTILQPFFRDHPGEPVPEDCFWSLWCKARLTEADTSTIRLGATPSGLTNAHLHHPPFFTGWMPFLRPTNSIEALKADHYIFILWFLFSSCFFPLLISAVGDWMSAILPHILWP